MSSLRVKGGVKLSGEIRPQGAKNEALQVICATLLSESDVTISNYPDIIDVNKLICLGEFKFKTVELALSLLDAVNCSPIGTAVLDTVPSTSAAINAPGRWSKSASVPQNLNDAALSPTDDADLADLLPRP